MPLQKRHLLTQNFLPPLFPAPTPLFPTGPILFLERISTPATRFLFRNSSPRETMSGLHERAIPPAVFRRRVIAPATSTSDRSRIHLVRRDGSGLADNHRRS